MVTWADKHQLSEDKKPFMAVYLKSRNGGNIVGGPSLQKHYRRRRRKTIESSFNSNPFQSKCIICLYNTLLGYRLTTKLD